MDVRQLSPTELWNHFEDLNAVPRPSKKEERVIAFMLDFGKKLGLETVKDPVGNVIIRKPASAGMENRETVILQAHLDMVHQKNAATAFDFDTQGIQSYIDGDWVKARGTTLGADNGIGVSCIMTLLSSKDIAHPAIEALFTIDEETGMTGAKELQQGLLHGKILLNLDTENDEEITIGCAGGLDTNTSLDYKEEATPAGSKGYRLSVKGLKGGHSGVDIHLGRGNANKLLTRLLWKTNENFGLRIASIDGGSLRNAIPREAFADITVKESGAAAFEKYFAHAAEEIKTELATVETQLQIGLEMVDLPGKVMDIASQENFLRALYALPNGVYRMSADIPGLVETSSNLARVIVKEGRCITQSLQRSSVESSKADISNAIRSCFELISAQVEQSGEYPGWAPNPSSPVLKIAEDIFKQHYGKEPQVAACHAGLECGILAGRYPGLDMVSIGPTINNPHSPDECVSVSSVQRFWLYLQEVLKAIPTKKG